METEKISNTVVKISTHVGICANKGDVTFKHGTVSVVVLADGLGLYF